MRWLYYDPMDSLNPSQYLYTMQILQSSKTGYYGKRPHPLPITTNLSSYYYSANPARYEMTVIGPSGARRYVDVPTAMFAPRPDDSHDMSRYNEAVAALNSAIRDGRWESGVFLGELKKTTRIVIDTVLQLAQFLGSIRRVKRRFVITRKRGRRTVIYRRVYVGTWRGVTKVSETLSGLWLLFRYGWLPLVSDMRDSVELFQKKMRIFDPRCFVKSFPKTARKTTARGLNPGYVYDTRYTTIKFKAWFSPPGSYMSLLSSFADQLGLTSPAGIIWELATLSFVVDWFVDIGGYFEALNRPIGYVINEIERNLFTRVSQTIDPNGTYRDSYRSVYTAKGASIIEDVVRYDRNSVPYPSPKIPTLEVDLNPKRVTDAIALLTGNFRRALRL